MFVSILTSLEIDRKTVAREPKWEASPSRVDAVTGRSLGEESGISMPARIREEELIYCFYQVNVIVECVVVYLIDHNLVDCIVNLAAIAARKVILCYFTV